jgi:hypothetical protein
VHAGPFWNYECLPGGASKNLRAWHADVRGEGTATAYAFSAGQQQYLGIYDFIITFRPSVRRENTKTNPYIFPKRVEMLDVRERDGGMRSEAEIMKWRRRSRRRYLHIHWISEFHK